MLTLEQKAMLAHMAEHGQAVQAMELCVELCEDYLVKKLLKRGGYGTLQLNAPDMKPRIRFVDPKEVKAVSVANIGGKLVSRESLEAKALPSAIPH